MKTTPKTRERRSTTLAGPLELRTDGELPPGACGIAVGVAVVYGVVDSYGTRFRAGCLDRTKREKLAAGKVKLFADHDGRTKAHIGYVKTLETQGDREVMTAILFDTEAGRTQKEYLAACLASGGYTGYSIGFYPRETERVEVDGTTVWDFVEVELDEVSNTPRPAVPGADALGVRREPGTPTVLLPSPDALRATLRVVIDRMGTEAVQAELAARTTASNARPDDSATAPGHTPADTRDADGTDSRDGTDASSAGATTATMDERMSAVRRSYSLR